MISEEDVQGLHDAADLGRHASHELALTNDALNQMREHLLKSLLEADPAESAKQNRIIATVNAVDLLREYLKKIVTEGKSATNLLEDYFNNK